MASRGILAFWALLVVGLLAVAAPLIHASAMEQSERHIDVVNESFTPDAGHVTLDDSNISYAEYDTEVEVYNGTDVLMDPSGNYTWYQSNGTLSVKNNSPLANSSDATITYGYEAQTAQQRDFSLAIGDTYVVWTILPLVIGIAALVFLILGLRGLA